MNLGFELDTQSLYATLLATAWPALWDVATVLTEAAATVLLADALIALVHFLMDNFGRPTAPFVGKVFAANDLHHVKPRAFLEHGPIMNSRETVGIGVGTVLFAFMVDMLTWHVVLFAVAVGGVNVVHRFAHQSEAENGRLVTFLQRCYMFVPKHQHGRHHTGTQDTHYAALTGFLNPVFESLGVFPALKMAIQVVTCVRAKSYV